MRKTIILSLISIFPVLLNAQSYRAQRNSIRIGVNRAFFGSGDVLGIATYGEYTYQINRTIGITPRVMTARGFRMNDTNFDHVSANSTSLSLRLSPLPGFFNRIKADIGIQYFSFVSAYGNNEGKNTFDQYESSDTQFYKERNFGLIGALHFVFLKVNNLDFGVRSDLLTAFYDGTLNAESPQIGFFVGGRF